MSTRAMTMPSTTVMPRRCSKSCPPTAPSAPTVVPKLSAANGIVYVYTKDPQSQNPQADAWYLTALDFRRKRATIGPALVPSGDIEADLAVIRAFYDGVQGRSPDRQGPIELAAPLSVHFQFDHASTM